MPAEAKQEIGNRRQPIVGAEPGRGAESGDLDSVAQFGLHPPPEFGEMPLDHASGCSGPQSHGSEMPASLLDHAVGGEAVVVLIKLQTSSVDPKRPAMAFDELPTPIDEHGAIEAGLRCER